MNRTEDIILLLNIGEVAVSLWPTYRKSEGTGHSEPILYIAGEMVTRGAD